MIDNPDIDAWRQRLATLLDGLDVHDPEGFRLAFEAVDEAGAQTSRNGLRRLAQALQPGREVGYSRPAAVAAIVLTWAALPPAERRAPATTRAERVAAAEHATSLATAVLRAVGTDREAGAVERLRRHVEWLAGVTPGLGS